MTETTDNSMVEEYNGVIIDYTKDKTIPEQGLALLTGKGFYKKDYEVSPQQSFSRAATCYSFGDYEFAQRIHDYVSNGWFTFASPVLSNAIDFDWPTFTEEEFEEAADWLTENVTPEGMPISCFLAKILDTKESLVETRKECSWLSMMGGGIGIHASNRSPDEKSTGVMAHLRGYDADALSYKQTESRRGSIGSYLDIDHPEIVNFIQMRNPVGGDQNKKCFNLNNAVNITDSFMEAVISNSDYELVDPKHGSTGRFLNAREVFEEIMEMRFHTGEPYILFKDTVNRNIPEWITRPLYNVSQSNLCSEITLMTSDTRTAVCCLSSLNLEKFEEWRDTNIVQDLVRLLDNVLEYFIRLAPKELGRAIHSAYKERAIGLGTLGWHSFLQSKMIPFESDGFNSAMHYSDWLYKRIKAKAVEESKRLATLRGEAPDCRGSGMRNSHLMAIAPNASSSSLVGASPSIEPWAANAFTAQGRAGSFLIKNKYLEIELEKLGLNNSEVWSDILLSEGSIQHIECIPDYIKLVFKTAREINQLWVIKHAGAKQLHICQSQSVNLFVRKNITKQEMVDLHISAWLNGLKSLYYCRAEPSTRANLGTGKDKPLNSVPVVVSTELESCVSCEG